MKNPYACQHAMKLLMTAVMAVAAGSATAQDSPCDCTHIVGTCTATFTLANVRDDPQRLNSSANVILTSSAPRCSKIGFYVDNTPYISVLKTSNRADERIFGTTRITPQTVSIESCKICASGNRNDTGKPRGAPLSDASQRFADALASKDFDPRETDRAFANIGSAAAGSDASLMQMMGAMQGAMEIMSLQRSAAGSSVGSSSQSKEICWRDSRYTSGLPCCTGYYGCERGPGPNDKIISGR